MAAFLKDHREKKLAPKVSSDIQNLQLLKEDVELKQKLLQQSEAIDKECMCHTYQDD